MGRRSRRANRRGLRRRLAGDPDPAQFGDPACDLRQTGSAAIECAYVAAGVFEFARFAGPRVWDVAAGIALVRAAGGTAWGSATAGGHRSTAFDPVPPATGLRAWRAPLLVGTPQAVERYAARHADDAGQAARRLDG
jgi:myo-inositol-1(or 4)-monophosphatase